MRSRVRHATALLVLALLLATGCTTTKMVEVWKAPDLTPADLDFKKVVAIAIFPEAARRRIAEDILAAEAERVPVTPAHQVLSRDDRADVDRVRARLQAEGFDGAVVIRLVGQTQNERWVPGTYAGGFYGYYGGYAGMVYDPGYMVTDTIVQIETSLHDVISGRLLWSGVSESLNPSNVESLIDDVVKAASKSLREEGLLP